MDAPTNKALLYARVSTQMQVEDGVSLGAQERQLIQAAEMYGFTEHEVVLEEGRSGKNVSGRPKLIDALKQLDEGKADALIVTRIDRLARSTKDFLDIVDRAGKNGWRLIMLDLNLDTSTYQGRFVVTIMSALAEMERGIIAERAKDIHKDRREQGIVWGKDMGPRPMYPPQVREQLLIHRNRGLSYQAIADTLNVNGVLAPRGGTWYASSVRNAINALTTKEGDLDGEEEKD
jgi:DNA invertase Pin-like site-specific DNA recombinase